MNFQNIYNHRVYEISEKLLVSRKKELVFDEPFCLSIGINIITIRSKYVNVFVFSIKKIITHVTQRT